MLKWGAVIDRTLESVSYIVRYQFFTSLRLTGPDTSACRFPILVNVSLFYYPSLFSFYSSSVNVMQCILTVL